MRVGRGFVKAWGPGPGGGGGGLLERGARGRRGGTQSVRESRIPLTGIS